MPSSWMLRRVALVRSDVSEERIATVIRVTRIGEPGTTLAGTLGDAVPRPKALLVNNPTPTPSNAGMDIRFVVWPFT
jgi:hypothetical protein